MNEEVKVLFVLAIGFAAACLFGYTAQKFKLSALLGYLFAGFLIGPNSPGFVTDLHLSEQLATIGVTLLMFAIGLNFSWKELLAVKRIAVPGALILSTLSILIAMFLSTQIGLSLTAGFIIGVALCVSSTVVVVRVLSDQNLVFSQQGHILMGWTIVEDLISIFVLIFLPVLTQPIPLNENPIYYVSFKIFISIIKIVILGALIYFLGERLINFILKKIARTRSHELFTLAILSIVFLIAVGSAYFFGVSIALGAFIAGTVVGKTDLSHQAAANAMPMRDAFTVVFFLSVGMLFNPAVLMENLPLFFSALFIVLIFRPLMAFMMIRGVNYALPIALTVALANGQIGEYSFILIEEASRLNVLPDSAYDIIVACAFVSIGLNPILFQIFKPITSKKIAMAALDHQKLDEQSIAELVPEFQPELTDSHEPILPRAIIVGYGPVGQVAAKYLSDHEYKIMIIDQNVDTITKLKEGHVDALFGDASQPQFMENLDLENVELLVITIPEFNVMKEMIQTVHHVNPHINIITRIRYRDDIENFGYVDIPYVCDEEMSAKGIAEVIQATIG